MVEPVHQTKTVAACGARVDRRHAPVAGVIPAVLATSGPRGVSAQSAVPIVGDEPRRRPSCRARTATAIPVAALRSPRPRASTRASGSMATRVSPRSGRSGRVGAARRAIMPWPRQDEARRVRRVKRGARRASAVPDVALRLDDLFRATLL